MAKPKGTVTSSQFEILQILWGHDQPLSIVQIWNEVRKQREVSRTTILNLVDRLEKRDWLSRKKVEGVFRYQAKIERSETENRLAQEFLGDFFEGSAGNFILSLLGNRKISKTEVTKLKKLLDGSSGNSKSNRGTVSKSKTQRKGANDAD